MSRPTLSTWFCQAALVLMLVLLPAEVQGLGENKILEYDIPTKDSGSTYVTSRSTGNMFELFFSETDAGMIGELDGGRRMREFQIPTPHARPMGIRTTASCLGSPFSSSVCDVWFAEADGAAIGKLDGSGKITERREHDLLGRPFHPFDVIAAAIDRIWFTDPSRSMVGQLNGTAAQYILVRTKAPPWMIALRDGNVVFTESISGLLGRVSGGQISEFSRIDAVDGARGTTDVLRPIMPARLAIQADGTIWFTQNWRIGGGDSRIGKVSPDGRITYVVAPTSNAGIADITVGPFGEMFFTEYQANKIGEIQMNGEIVEWDIPTADSGPLGITATAAGVAFVEHKANKIGYLHLLKPVAVPAQ